MKISPWVLAASIAVAGLAGCERRTQEKAGTPSPSSQARMNAPRADAPEAGRSPARQTASADAFSDSVITTRIKSAILSDPGMGGSDVSVNTDRGVVSLTGLIKSQEQAAIASAYAQRQDGVMRVDNQLAVNLH